MKASLFAEDEEDKDLFQDYGAIKLSSDVSSPRLIFPGSQSRLSGGKPLTVYLCISCCISSSLASDFVHTQVSDFFYLIVGDTVEDFNLFWSMK